jgi:hypothetical protein
VRREDERGEGEKRRGGEEEKRRGGDGRVRYFCYFCSSF